jgi:hypothetical protein
MIPNTSKSVVVLAAQVYGGVCCSRHQISVALMAAVACGSVSH